jgi:hypothetical protein
MASPVLGFPPFPPDFYLTTKFPNPDIIRFSPFSRVVLIKSKTSSAISTDSFFDKPIFS